MPKVGEFTTYVFDANGEEYPREVPAIITAFGGHGESLRVSVMALIQDATFVDGKAHGSNPPPGPPGGPGH